MRPWIEKQVKQMQASVDVVMRGQWRREKQQSGPSRSLAGLLLRAGARQVCCGRSGFCVEQASLTEVGCMRAVRKLSLGVHLRTSGCLPFPALMSREFTSAASESLALYVQFFWGGGKMSVIW